MSMVMWVDTPWGDDCAINQCDKAISLPLPSKWNVYSRFPFSGPNKIQNSDCDEYCRLEDAFWPVEVSSICRNKFRVASVGGEQTPWRINITMNYTGRPLYHGLKYFPSSTRLDTEKRNNELKNKNTFIIVTWS